MGALGSGRHRNPNARQTTSGVPAMDVRKLKKQGALLPGQQFTWQWFRHQREVTRVVFTSEHDGLLVSQELSDASISAFPLFIHLTWTHCHLGGERAWFICPECGRRCALLYLNPNIACRECHQMVYVCQREIDFARLIRRTNKLRRRLGWEAGILNYDGDKPKGLHWHTYYRRMRQQQHFQLLALSELGCRVQSVTQRISSFIPPP